MDAGLQVVASAARLTLCGELDCNTAPLLIDALAASDEAVTELDLAGVTFIDSSGLKSLLRARREADGLRVVNASTTVLRLLEMTGLEHLLTP